MIWLALNKVIAKGLFGSTQDTAIFVLVVDTFVTITALCAEIEVAMEIEDERLVEILHFCVLCVWRKCRQVFRITAVAFDRERVHHHYAEAPFVLVIADADGVIELTVLQRFAPQVIAPRRHVRMELPTVVHTHDTRTDTRIKVRVRIVVTLRNIVVGKWGNREDQAVLQHAHLDTRRYLQTMKTALVVVRTNDHRRTVYQLLKTLLHNRLVVVAVVRPKVKIDMLGLPR